MRQRANFGGNSISYLRCGDGYPTLLLHRLSGSGLDWAPVLMVLGEHMSAYAPDLPGRGESFSVEEPDHAALLCRFLNFLGIAQANVVAAPESAAIALELANRFPRKIAQVMIAEPAEPADHLLDALGRRQPLPFDW